MFEMNARMDYKTEMTRVKINYNRNWIYFWNWNNTELEAWRYNP